MKWHLPAKGSKWLLVEPWTVGVAVRHRSNWEVIRRFSIYEPLWGGGRVQNNPPPPPGKTYLPVWNADEGAPEVVEVTIPAGTVFQLRSLAVRASKHPNVIDSAVYLRQSLGPQQQKRRRHKAGQLPPPPLLEVITSLEDASRAEWVEV